MFFRKIVYNFPVEHKPLSSDPNHQEEAMNALLSKRDVFLMAPTGAGKSLCFQAPALVTGNLTLARGPSGDPELPLFQR